MGRGSIEGWLADMDNLRALVTEDVNLLASAYDDVANDLNLTSLCLYSGPAGYNPAGTTYRLQGRHGPVGIGAEGGIGIRNAWLGTGDADLRQRTRRADFSKHYGRLLSHVTTMTLPHHGSARNFDPALIAMTGADLYLAAADKFGTWQHPGATVVQSIFSAGAMLHVVTSHDPSISREKAAITI